MPSLNNVLLLGHLGGAPEVRATQAGRPILKISLATNRHWRVGGGDADGEWREETDWHRVVLFGPLAERLRDRMDKGDLILIEGRLSRRTWRAEDGTMRSVSEVVAHRAVVLGRPVRRPDAPEPLFDEAGGGPDAGDGDGDGAWAAPSGRRADGAAAGTAADADVPF